MSRPSMTRSPARPRARWSATKRSRTTPCAETREAHSPASGRRIASARSRPPTRTCAPSPASSMSRSATSWPSAAGSSGAMPRSRASTPTARYIAPVSTCAKPRRRASVRLALDFPAPAGPSTVMTPGFTRPRPARRDPVALLDAELGGSRDRRLAVGERRGDAEDRELVDRARHLGGRHHRSMETRGADAQLGARLARDVARVEHLDRRAHAPEDRERAGARRVDADAGEAEHRARDDQRGDDEKRRRGDVARQGHRRAAEALPACDLDRARAADETGAKVREEALGVVAARERLADARRAARPECREEDRGFDL